MSKSIFFNEDARNALLSGIQMAGKVIGQTLGPCGKTVVLSKSYGSPLITKDGVSVAKDIELKDTVQNLGVKMMREATVKANGDAGDGTTTTAVLVDALTTEANKAVSGGVNAREIERGMTKASEVIIDFIRSSSKKINSSEEIKQVATISANGDTKIGEMLAEAFDKVGRDGVVNVQEAKSSETELRIEDGMQFDRGYLSPYFVTDSEKMSVEFDKPYILMCDKKISNLQQILTLLEKVVQSARPLLIIAEDIEGEALATLVVNKLRGGLKVAAVKAPGFGERRKAMLEDIAILTGGTVISEDIGHKIENTDIEHLGQAQKILITKDNTTIVAGTDNEASVKTRCEQIKHQIEESTSEYDIEKLQERLAKLSGGIAVIGVGGATETEVKEKKDRVDDAYHATKAAIAEGIVPGGGSTLMYGSLKLRSLKGDTLGEDAGIRAVANALRAPIMKILSNAGCDDAALIAGKLMEQNNTSAIYDARNYDYVDAYESGIIDPAKVVRVAVESAISTAKLITTTGATVVDEPKDDNATSGGAPGMGGMGGMGDMGMM